MQIPFAAFAEDCLVSGQLALESDRLSDFLSSTTEFELEQPSFHALDDGREVSADSCQLTRDDLCVVMATGPRGQVERRLWTRQHAVRVRVGPYTVVGYLHAPPTIDPFHMAERRSIVALTSSIVGRPDGAGTTWVEADAVLVNTAKIEHLETATEDDIRLAKSIEAPPDVDPGAKDFTAAP